MCTLTRKCIVSITFLTCLSICVSVEAQSKATKPGGATISGRVTIRGKPATGVVIQLQATNFYGRPVMSSYRGVTDEEGEYRIADVSAGTYHIAPIAPVYVSTDSATGGSKSIILSEGESVPNIDFALIRGGVVTGKITDSDGRPLIEQRVSLIPVESEQRSNVVRPGPNGPTDDRGIYRLFGVRPGRYVVSVGQDDRTFSENVAMGRRTFRQTFHPNVSDIARATTIEVGEGTEASNIDIAVGRAEETFSVSGRVVDETGQPVSNVQLGIRTIKDGPNAYGGGFAGTYSISNAKGEFQIDNLVAGKFAIFMSPSPEVDLYADPVNFEIKDEDLSGVVLRAQKGASISGVLSLEGSEEKTLVAKLQLMRMYAFVQSEGVGSAVGRDAKVNPDLSFRLGGLGPGMVHLQLGSIQSSMQPEFTILRIEREGVIQTPGLIVKMQEPVTGVRVVVTHSTGKIRGLVQVVNGELPATAHIAVRINRPIPAAVDGRGRFIIENLATGTYELNVSAYWQGFRGRPPTHQQQITVTDGETTEVSVVLDLKTAEPIPRQSPE